MHETPPGPPGPRGLDTSRRDFIRRALAGTAVVALGGGLWVVASDQLTSEARAQTLPDGRPRLPPGQKVISFLRPMGGQEGDPNPRNFRLKVHGAVDSPFTIDYRELLALPQSEQALDVHCVTTWSALGQTFSGVRIKDLADKAGVRPEVRHVIIEAAHGYTANVRLDQALAGDSMIVHHHNGDPLARRNGGPVRAVVPQLYFWKSAKWVTGLRFVAKDEPGYWEVRGYNNNADPWKEQRYA